MAGRKHIQTSVDKLVSLIDEKERISFKEAAKKLATPISTIEEWAHFLEEEEILFIEYKFATPYLVKKHLTKKEKAEKVKEFVDSKKSFNNKITAATSYFNELDKKIAMVTKTIDATESGFATRLNTIQKEMKRLKQLEEQKKNIDDKILTEKKEYLQNIGTVEKEVSKEKQNYMKAFAKAKSKIENETKEITRGQNLLKKMKVEEKDLQHKLTSIKKESHKLEDEIVNHAKIVKFSEEHMNSVRENLLRLHKNLDTDHRKLMELLQTNERKEQEIQDLQKKILENIDQEEEKISEEEKQLQKLPVKFEELFSKRNEVRTLLEDIKHKEIDLQTEIATIERKAKSLKFITGINNKEDLEDIQDKIDDITKSREFFEEKIKKIIAIFDKL